MKRSSVLRLVVIVSVFLLPAMVFHVHAIIREPEPSVSPTPTPTLPTLPPFNFALQLTPPTATVEQGQTANYTIIVTYSHLVYSRTKITIQVMGLDPSMQYQLPTFGNLVISTSTFTSAGSYPFTIIGSANGVVQQTSGVLIVTVKPPPFDYSVSITPSTQTVNLGKTAVYTVTVSLVSGSGEPVTLSLAGLPADIQYGLSNPSGTPTYSSSLTIDTSGSTSSGKYIFEIVASGEGKIKRATASLNVVKPTISPQATLTVSPKAENTSNNSNTINNISAAEAQAQVKREVSSRFDLINKLSMGAIFTALLTLVMQYYQNRRDSMMSMKITAAQKLEAALNAYKEKAEEIEEKRSAAEIMFIVEILTIVFILLIFTLSK